MLKNIWLDEKIKKVIVLLFVFRKLNVISLISVQLESFAREDLITLFIHPLFVPLVESLCCGALTCSLAL